MFPDFSFSLSFSKNRVLLCWIHLRIIAVYSFIFGKFIFCILLICVICLSPISSGVDFQKFTGIILNPWNNEEGFIPCIAHDRFLPACFYMEWFKTFYNKKWYSILIEVLVVTSRFVKFFCISRGLTAISLTFTLFIFIHITYQNSPDLSNVDKLFFSYRFRDDRCQRSTKKLYVIQDLYRGYGL